MPVSIVELNLSDPDDSHSRVQFDGLLVRLTVRRALSGTTLLVPNDRLLGPVLERLRGRSAVALDDANDDRVWRGWTTDPASARALLTPAFLHRLFALGAQGGQVHATLLADGSALTIAMPKQGFHDYLEPPSWSDTAAAAGSLAWMRADLSAMLALADAVLELAPSTRPFAVPLPVPAA